MPAATIGDSPMQGHHLVPLLLNELGFRLTSIQPAHPTPTPLTPPTPHHLTPPQREGMVPTQATREFLAAEKVHP